jgi:hypothetical protein
VILVGSRLERREDGRSHAGVLGGYDGGRPDAGGAWVTHGRQPAVRRRLLRRSCQFGGGEYPAGAYARPAECIVRYLVAGSRCLAWDHALDGARRAPRALEDVEIVITKSGNIRCRRRAHGRFRWPGGESDSVAGL